MGWANRRPVALSYGCTCTGSCLYIWTLWLACTSLALLGSEPASLLCCNQRIGFRFAAVAVNTAARGSAVIPCPHAASPTCPSTTTSRSRRPWRRVDTTTCGRHRQTVGDADGHEQPGQQGVSTGLRVKCAQGLSGILPITRTKTGGAGANTREKHPRVARKRVGTACDSAVGFPCQR